MHDDKLDSMVYVCGRGNGKSYMCAKMLEERMKEMEEKKILVGNMANGYHWVSPIEAAAINNYKPEKEDLEDFCNKNHIIYTARTTATGVMVKFYDKIHNRHFVKDLTDEEFRNVGCMESYLLRLLKNKMKEWERETMNYSESYKSGSLFGAKKPEIKNVIFNGPATIVQWSDGDKTIVKCENEDFDKEKGLAMAICKKLLGTNKSHSNYNDIFKKWIPEEKEEDYIDTALADLCKLIDKAMNTSFENAMNPPVKSKVLVKEWTVKDYAEACNVSVSTIRRMIRDGKLKTRKEGRIYLILEEVGSND